MKNLQSVRKLNNGISMPYVGLGVYKMDNPEETVKAVKTALSKGYRSIDTAAFYKNEDDVGRAVMESGVPRKDVFITSKVWNDDQGYDATLRAFEHSLEQLGTEYLDLYLIHWPVADKIHETWKAMERLYDEGVIRSIGVSNFQIHHLRSIMKNGNIKPAVNQVELHPKLSQLPLREFCQKEDIAVEAWSPLARGRLLEEPVLAGMARNYNKTPAQIILKWHLENGVIIIPKSVRENRIRENADLFDFELTAEDMKQIDNLHADERYGAHPDHFDF